MVGRLQPVYSKGPSRDERLRLAQLRDLASTSEETLVVYKASGKSVIWTLACASLATAIGAMFAQGQIWVVAWLFWGLAMVLTLTCLIVLVAHRTPCLTLSPYGLVLPNMARPMPWTAITDYSIGAYWTPLTPGGSHPNALILRLSPEYRVRGLRGPRISSIYSRGKHQFHLFIGDSLRLDSGESIEDLREFARFVEYFLTYWRAGLARSELAQLNRD